MEKSAVVACMYNQCFGRSKPFSSQNHCHSTMITVNDTAIKKNPFHDNKAPALEHATLLPVVTQ